MKPIVLVALSALAVFGVGAAEAHQARGRLPANHHHYHDAKSASYGRCGDGDRCLRYAASSILNGYGPWGGSYEDPYAWDPYFLDKGYHGFGRPYGQSRADAQ